MQEQVEAYNSGWQDGFGYALDTLLEAINRNYDEADREGDDEYIISVMKVISQWAKAKR